MRFTNHVKKQVVLSTIIAILTITIGLSSFIVYFLVSEFRDETTHLKEKYYTSQKDLIQSEMEEMTGYIDYYSNLIEEKIKESLKDRAYDGYYLAEAIYNNNKEEKSIEEIREIVKVTLKHMNYDDENGFYFVVPKDSSAYTEDSHKNEVINNMFSYADDKQEGYFDYSWSRNSNPGQYADKISYIKYYEPLNLIIGTGNYVDDIVDEIKLELANRIRESTYGEDGYFYIVTLDGIAIVFPAELSNEGKYVGGILDTNNVNIHQEHLKVVNELGYGFVKYNYKQLGSNDIHDKIAYVQYIEAYDWIIGTNSSLFEIDETIKEKEAVLTRQIVINLSVLLLIIFSLGAIIITVEYKLFKRLNRAFDEEERLYETLINLSVDGILIIEKNGDLLLSNDKGLELLNCEKQEVELLNIIQLIGYDYISNLENNMQLDCSIQTLSGEEIPVEINFKSIYLNNREKYVAYIRDLSDRKKYEKKLKDMATIDELTKIYNRRFVIKQLEEELKLIKVSRAPISLVMIDIDKFKNINDTYGHVFGDKVLQIFAKILKSYFKDTDFVGRYGGEEFLVILPYTNKEKAFEATNNIKDIVTSKEWEHENLTTSFSAGIIEINETNMNLAVKEHLKSVDEMLYKAKRNGRNRIEVL